MSAALCALAVTPCASVAQTNAEQVMAIGRNVLSMDDYMLAIQYFNQAIKAKPYMADPYFFRAIAKLNLDDYQGAQRDCDMAIERNKFKTEAYKVRGFARQNLGLDSLAIEDYNIGLEYDPTDKYFLFYKAVAQTELERFEGADSTFSTLLRLYPRFEEGFSARGRMNTMRGDTVAGLRDIDRSLELSKTLVNSYLMRAEIEWNRKEWEKAAADIDEAIHLRPDAADLYVNRAFLRYNSDDFFGAMSDYNYALELEPRNMAALFNRALLRYEVKDLGRAVDDLNAVLELDPSNFHALYNRALINLERGENRLALTDFEAIARRYPRFYPVYYGIAEVKRNLGDMKSAMQNAYYADELVKKYVKNPEANPLDRPTIAAATSNSAGKTSKGGDGDDGESEIEVMNRFNQLVTVSGAAETQLSYNEKIKGRVQDRNLPVEPEPLYAVSFTPGPQSLQSLSNYFRELDELNQQRSVPQTFYVSPVRIGSVGSDELQRMFDTAEELARKSRMASARPVDHIAYGVALTMLKNYDGAIEAFDKALAVNPRFAVALMGRAYARQAAMAVQASGDGGPGQDEEQKEAQVMLRRDKARIMADIIADYDAALKLNPRLVYAWFNKGNLYYGAGDYTSAMRCYAEALNIDPEFGQAYYNRGLSYLQAGNRQQAFSDLSKAGELGVLPSYNLLKRMK